MISDYVAGRLDWVTAKLVEAAARNDPAIERSIRDAQAVRKRVKDRLIGLRE